MQSFTSLAAVPADFGPSAVTIGKFDGLHVGHRAVLAELIAVAKNEGLTTTVVTFDRNPLSVLNPAQYPPPLISNEQKLRMLAEAGIDVTVMLAFDVEFSQQSPEQFVQSILVDALHAKVVLIGADFRFGSHGAGNVSLLTELGERFGFRVLTIGDVRPTGSGRRVSSTWIRELMAKGDVAAVSSLLGRAPSVRAMVVHGQHRGRQLGYPTANLSSELEGLVPADGVYAAWLAVNGHRFPAAASVGNNPTFEKVPDRQVEAYVLDEVLDLYGQTVELSFVQRLRGMEKFDSVTELVAQIRQDEADTRHVLSRVAAR